MRRAEFTTNERVLLHLNKYQRFAGEYVAPVETTQRGIGAGLGISRAHAAVSTVQLVNEGLLEERLAHVNGATHKLKAFNLSSKGVEIVVALKKNLEKKGKTEDQVIMNPVNKYIIDKTLCERIDELEQRIKDLEARVED